MRGILMIEPLYPQTIAGNKTQTRRSSGLEEVNHKPNYWSLILEVNGEAGFRFNNSKQRNPNHLIQVFCKARYKVGEVLYIKEPYWYNSELCNRPLYKYEYNKMDYPIHNHPAEIVGLKWKNKMFMPASAARAFIRITGIKCERLLDISDEDCIAEGIQESGFDEGYYINYLMNETYGYDYLDNTPQESFISLYKFANKLAKVGSVPPHGSLPTPPDVENIWVWAYTFEYLPDYKIQ